MDKPINGLFIQWNILKYKQSIDTLIHAIKWVNFTDGKKPDTKEHTLYDLHL